MYPPQSPPSRYGLGNQTYAHRCYMLDGYGLATPCNGSPVNYDAEYKTTQAHCSVKDVDTSPEANPDVHDAVDLELL